MKNDMEKYRHSPRHVWIENTNICNAVCSFCPHENMKRKQGVMDFDLYKKIIDEIAALSTVTVASIHGFGEPLLDKQFIQRIEYAKKKNLPYVSTNTNASFLNEEISRKIIESGLNEIYISFDSATEENYRKIRNGINFHEVEENIKFLCAQKKKNNLKKPFIYLSFVTCEENKNEVKLYQRKWKSIVDGISISILHNWAGFTIENWYKNGMRRDPCRAIWTDMNIHWDGSVPLCCYDYETATVLGDIKRQSITDIWNGDIVNTLREDHKRGWFENINTCRNCVANVHHKSPWWISK